MTRIPKRVRCSVCRKAWASLGLPSNLTAQFVRNSAVNEKTRKLFEPVFGKNKAAKIRSTKDIEACFLDFTKRYQHLAPGYKRGESYDLNSAADLRKLGHPGDVSRDPFPNVPITERPGHHPERRVI